MAINLVSDLLDELKHHRTSVINLSKNKCTFGLIITGDDGKEYVETLETTSTAVALVVLKALREGA